jgi:hypothetical protein
MIYLRILGAYGPDCSLKDPANRYFGKPGPLKSLFRFEWGGAMRAQEYRSKSAACFLAAEHSKLPDVRNRWLAMAQAWLKLADEVEKRTRLDLVDGKDETPNSN